MPFNNVEEFQKSFPGIKHMTTEQKKKALEIFNSMMKTGSKEGSAIAVAMDKARKMGDMPMDAKKCAEQKFIIDTRIALSDVTDEQIDTTEFEILKVGEYTDQRYGKFSITKDKLLALKKNFDDNVLEIDVALDASHEPEAGALAWIKGLKIDGDRLLMSLKDVTTRGREVIRDKVFKYFSVEFDSFSKILDGKKVTIPDVLRGVALTNRPVIKGMAPTFFSERANKSFITANMSVFAKFAEELTKRGKVTADDVKMATMLFDELSSEEQEAEKPAMVSVEAEAAKTAEAEAEAKVVADKAAADAAEAAAKAAADAEGKVPEAAAAALSEANTKLAETQKELADFKAAEAQRVLSERVKSLTLSESNTKGFSATLSEKLTSFVADLDEDGYKAFSELLGAYVSVNTKELGSGVDGAEFADGKTLKVGSTTYAVKGAQQDAEIKALSELKKISYFEAATEYAETHKS